MPLCGGSSFAAMNTHLTPNPLLAKHESHLCADWGQRQPAHGKARCWALSVAMWTLPRALRHIKQFDRALEAERIAGLGLRPMALSVHCPVSLTHRLKRNQSPMQSEP